MRFSEFVQGRMSTGTPVDTDVMETGGIGKGLSELEYVTDLEETADSIACGGFEVAILRWVRWKWHVGIDQVQCDGGGVFTLVVDFDVF
jgi:hypothetical protein